MHVRQGDFVEAQKDGQPEGEWLRAEVIGATDAGLELRWVDDDTCICIDEADVRMWTPQLLPTGTHVTVAWNGKHYTAVVIAARSGMHLVRYDDWDESWDEWVSPDRIVATT